MRLFVFEYGIFKILRNERSALSEQTTRLDFIDLEDFISWKDVRASRRAVSLSIDDDEDDDDDAWGLCAGDVRDARRR